MIKLLMEIDAGKGTHHLVYGELARAQRGRLLRFMRIRWLITKQHRIAIAGRRAIERHLKETTR